LLKVIVLLMVVLLSSITIIIGESIRPVKILQNGMRMRKLPNSELVLSIITTNVTTTTTITNTIIRLYQNYV
jgi:hypothetical protein